jgi:peroxiredoxin
MSIDIVEDPMDTTQREVPSGRKPAATDVPPLKVPVCEMAVTSHSPHMALHEGTAVYFCSAG